MTEKEVNQLLEKGETHKVEYKPSLSDTDRIIEVVCSFANAEGGVVLIGVKDQKERIKDRIIGITIGKDTIGRVVNKITDKTDPPIYPNIEVVKIFGKNIVVIEVTKGRDKPYTASGRPFIRIGDVTKQMKRSEYERMLIEKNKDKLRFDTQICDGANWKDIDEKKARWFLRKAKTERGLDIDDSLPVKEVLIRLKLTVDGKLTNTAILLFGKRPQDFFEQSEIKCIRFKGTDVTGKMLDLKPIRNNIIDAVIDTEKFIFDHISMSAWIEEGKIERQEKWEYPPKAIREALVNAIVHRDYESTSKVQVRIFDDRIEFWNPGRLPEGWTVETLKKRHESIPWNPLIAKQFFLIKYIEEVGTGTNKIVEWCFDWGLPEPEFEFTGTSLALTFRKSKLTEEYIERLGLNKRQMKTIKYLKEHNHIGNKEYREINTIGKVIAVKELNQMVEKGILKIVGKGRALRYELND
ncbi:MAG: putative DNA binding domain-containing protein [Actinobacteria bacterium]|nr:putative DNA binding domain-containing protein [Actinomycetota bacterium]MBU4482978.1 putative DNA binding domain-containing protein [Actinomycetota bacterium]MCG2791415.1 putative DNA binding domain-containing protein [Actinomycetes bacterium]